MTGATPDPLDRIAENARYAPNKPRRYPSWDEVEALVEVARAARGVLTQMDYETPHHTRLKEALARLDNP